MGTAYPSLRWLRAAGFVPRRGRFSPQECIEQLAMQGRDYDVDYVSIRFCLPAGPEHERVLDCIRLFGEEVLPRFHG